MKFKISPVPVGTLPAWHINPPKPKTYRPLFLSFGVFKIYGLQLPENTRNTNVDNSQWQMASHFSISGTVKKSGQGKKQILLS